MTICKIFLIFAIVIQNVSIMRTIKVKKNNKISYDPHMLDGIHYVDNASAMYYLKSMISGDVYDRKSPYVPVRLLVKYFDKDTGVLRHGCQGSAALVKFLFKRPHISRAINGLTKKHGELLHLIYVQKDFQGSQLMERVSWKLQAIMDDVRTLIKGIETSDAMTLFENTEAIQGSTDGRRLGLKDIVFRAALNLSKIDDQVRKLEGIMRRGKDPFSYSLSGRRYAMS